jgi:hypothetical protein
MSEWQPIETAPKDGKPVLLLEGETIPDTPHIVVGTYIDGSGAEELGYREYAKYGGWLYWHSDGEFYVVDIDDPTDWAPIPRKSNPREAESAAAAEPTTQRAAAADTILWCCHVRGPDDVHAAPDYKTALKWSDIINEWSRKANKGVKEEDELWARATPALWPWSPESHAEDLPKSIAEFAIPSPAPTAAADTDSDDPHGSYK